MMYPAVHYTSSHFIPPHHHDLPHVYSSILSLVRMVISSLRDLKALAF